MVNEARTTAESARASAVLRRTGESRGLRGAVLGALMLLGAGMTVAAAAAPSGLDTAVSVTADGSSPWSDTDTGPHNAKVRQGQTVAYQVQVKPSGSDAAKNVTVTLATTTTPDWAAKALTVTCPKGATVIDSGCSFDSVSDAVTVGAEIAVPKSATVGSSFGVTATVKSDAGTSDPTTATKTTVVKPGSTGGSSSSPTPTRTTSPSSDPTKTGGSGGGGGSGGNGGSGNGGGSGGGSGGGNGSGNGQSHPSLPPGSNPSAVPSLGIPSLSATSVSGLPTSQPPTPLVAFPPTTGTSASPSPSNSIQLTGESRGSVHAVTGSIPLAAAGLVLFVVCAWQLMRRYAIGRLAGVVGKFSGVAGKLGKLGRFTKSS